MNPGCTSKTSSLRRRRASKKISDFFLTYLCASVSLWLIALSLEQRPDFLVLGKAAGFELREDSSLVQKNFKASVGERAQFERNHALLELFQDLLRQPDGMRLVLSASAILNSNLHGLNRLMSDGNRKLYRESRGSVITAGWAAPVTPPEYSSTLTTTSPSNLTKTVRSGGVP